MTPTRDCSASYIRYHMTSRIFFYTTHRESRAELYNLQRYDPTIKINSGMIATKLTNQVD